MYKHLYREESPKFVNGCLIPSERIHMNIVISLVNMRYTDIRFSLSTSFRSAQLAFVNIKTVRLYITHMQFHHATIF